MEHERNTFLYFAAATVNLIQFGAGTAYAWPSPVIPKLSEANPSTNPFSTPITTEEGSWIVSLMPLGAAIGPFAGGHLSDKIGRKRVLLISLLPAMVSFLMLAFATDVLTFYAARFTAGVGAGMALAVTPMYIGEVAEIHNRGILGCFLNGFITTGILFTYTVGPYVSIMWFNLACSVCPAVCFVVLAVFIPESPYYWLAKNEPGKARSALLKLRSNDGDAVDKELSVISGIVKESLATRGGAGDVFKSKALRKALLVTVGLAVVQQLTGISAVMFYLQSIFESAGSAISSDVSAIVVGAVQCLGCAVAMAFVDRYGRKILLVLSAAGTAVTLASLGTYFHLKEAGQDVESLFWLPIASLIAYIAAYNLGFGPLPWTIVGEVFPPHVKSAATAITACVCLGVSFCTSKFFPLLVDVIGASFALWLFALSSVAGIAFVYAFVPETKGKSLSEILVKLDK